jgi:4-hydroxy-2-oxoheptanedioate aldolase
MLKNRFKRLALAGHPQHGIFCVSNALQNAEALAHSGFDFVAFDLEHSPQSMPTLHAQLAAFSGGGSAAIVRVAALDLTTFKHCLDLGADALMIPNVNSAEEARTAVSYTRYPPEGLRGMGGTMRVTRYGRDKSYFQGANDNCCLIVQIESQQALRQLDDICAVPGVDMVFFGPTDLSADMGYLGQASHADVVQSIESGIRQACRRGVAVGVMAMGPDCERYLQAGATMVIHGSDLGLLVRGADTLAQQYVRPPSST